MQEIKNSPHVYTTQEGIAQINNNPQVHTTQECMQEIKKTLRYTPPKALQFLQKNTQLIHRCRIINSNRFVTSTFVYLSLLNKSILPEQSNPVH